MYVCVFFSSLIFYGESILYERILVSYSCSSNLQYVYFVFILCVRLTIRREQTIHIDCPEPSDALTPPDVPYHRQYAQNRLTSCHPTCHITDNTYRLTSRHPTCRITGNTYRLTSRHPTCQFKSLWTTNFSLLVFFLSYIFDFNA